MAAWAALGPASPGRGGRDAALLELLAEVRPDVACLRRWICVLEDRLSALSPDSKGSASSPEFVVALPRPKAKSTRRTSAVDATVLGSAAESEAEEDLPNVAELGAASPTWLLEQNDTLPKRQSGGWGVETHRLPAFVTWSITLLIAVVVAFTNNLIVWATSFLVELKFHSLQRLMTYSGVVVGTLLLMCINSVFSFATACLVCLVAPICAGSGLPESKGYLNGNHINGLFKGRVVAVRIVGIILATAAGFPIGREGPMVAIGGGLGCGVVHVLAMPWVRRWVKVDLGIRCQSSALLVDEERFATAKRIGFTLGGAAGIATAFDAPVGGILYMFEEATMTVWPPALTFRVFICTVSACLISKGIFNLAGQDVHRLLVYMDAEEYQGSWDWMDMPLFICLAAVLGLLSALHARVLIMFWSARKRAALLPYSKIKECVAYAALCSIAYALLPLAVGCARDIGHPGPALQNATVDKSLHFVRHACPEGHINEMATLLLKGTEGSLKHLYSRNTEDFHLGALALTLCLYMFLNAGMAGLAVPMGNFVPSMLIGALAGRILGEAVAGSALAMGLADAGVYAMVGSAAMLGGFTHMTIAVVVILVEAARDLSLISPLMLSVSISHIVSACVNRHSYDEVLILKKAVPFLEPELPREMDNHGIVAADLCQEIPSSALLAPEATIDAVQRALERREVMHFPVIADGVCIGLLSRARLEAAMRARGASLQKAEATPRLPEEPDEVGDDIDVEAFVQELCALKGHSDEQSFHIGGDRAAVAPVHESTLLVYRLMDPSPYTLLEEMPVPRLYPLFTRTGATAACVISRQGEFRGVLSRVNLLSAAGSAWSLPKRRLW